MQNGPPLSKMVHMSFYLIQQLFTKPFVVGRGDVTSLHIACKSSKNVRKLAFADFEGGGNDRGCSDCIFLDILTQSSHTGEMKCGRGTSAG
jgi:hypothetical protein